MCGCGGWVGYVCVSDGVSESHFYKRLYDFVVFVSAVGEWLMFVSAVDEWVIFVSAVGERAMFVSAGGWVSHVCVNDDVSESCLCQRWVSESCLYQRWYKWDVFVSAVGEWVICVLSVCPLSSVWMGQKQLCP